MKVSLNTVQQYIDVELPPIDQLVDRINQQLGGVEEVIDLGAKYQHARIVKVVECIKHPNADKLSLCQVDVGEKDLVQVVCGANNVRPDMWAVWLPPKSIVPSSYDTDEPFVLEAKELRGEMSHGMLASAREMDLGNDHDGIIEITENDLPQGYSIKVGDNFAKVFGLDDTIIDIENKMFTHRPDLFGQLGVAREISAILLGVSDKSLDEEDTSFRNPDWYWQVQQFESGDDSLALDVFNEASDRVPRFMAVAMNDVSVGPSPLWLQCELVRWGAKSINNVVDLTNYMMLLTAQPTHAYDYDKLRGHKLGARMAKEGESISLLNGKRYKLTADDIVIADGEGAVGLAGVMGGADSEVSTDTKNIVLEVANFDMYAVRRSSMRHGLFTDALTRFNKGQSWLQNDRVTARLMTLLTKITGAKQASRVFDLPDKSDQPAEASIHGEVLVGVEFINQRLGLNLTTNQIGALLRRTNFAVYPSEEDSSRLSVTAPYWRTDIELPEDVVEEVGRLYGFTNLPLELPGRSTKPTAVNPSVLAKQSIRSSLAKAGANEVLTYSFVHENTIKRAEQDVSQAFQLSNALSPDLQYYRLTVLPSLLDKVHANIKAGHDEFVLYEIGKGHNKQHYDDGLPSEIDFVDAVYASKKPADNGAAFYHIRRLLDQLADDHGVSLVYTPADPKLEYSVSAPFELARSAMVGTADGNLIGMIGELRQSVVRGFKLPSYTAAMTLDLQSLMAAMNAASRRYRPLSRYPSVWQDLSLRVTNDVAYHDLTGAVSAAMIDEGHKADVYIDIEPIAVYRPDNNAGTKTVTYRISATHYGKTLSDNDLRQVIDKTVQIAGNKYGAQVA